MSGPLPHPLAPAEQLLPWVKQKFPNDKVDIAGGNVVVFRSNWYAVAIISSATETKLGFVMPLLSRIILGICFAAGILPGILLAVIVIFATKSSVAFLEKQIEAALRNEPMPTLGEKPPGLMKKLAPAWMFFLAIALVITGFIGPFLSSIYVSGYQHANERADRYERMLKSAQASLARVEKGETPPKTPCPETDDGWSYQGTCHGCQTSPPYSNRKAWKVHDWKDNQKLYCPPPAILKTTIAKYQRWIESDSSTATENLILIILYPILGLVFLAGAVFLFILWRKKNKIRRAELQEAQPTNTGVASEVNQQQQRNYQQQ